MSKFWPLATGIVAAAVVAGLTLPATPARWPLAAVAVWLAFSAAAAATFAALFIRNRRLHPDAVPFSVLFAAGAAWLIPGTLLFRASSLWTPVVWFGAALLLLLPIRTYWEWRLPKHETVCAHGLSILLQATVAYLAMERPREAIVPAVLGALLFTHAWPRGEPDARHSPARRALATVLVASLVTAGLLISRLPGRRGGSFTGESAVVRSLGVRVLGSPDEGEPDRSAEAEPDGGGTYRGVILFPDLPDTPLQIPVVAPLHPALTSGRVQRSFEIPFFGVYWFYRRPHHQPPPGSFIRKGDPAELSYRSVRGVPMRMEARQHLNSLIDVASLDSIQVGVRNADQYPGSVSLELELVNTTLRFPQTLVLGSLPVDSGLLEFGIPNNARLRAFDEIRVTYRLARLRDDHSAKIAIDSFVLVPRTSF